MSYIENAVMLWPAWMVAGLAAWGICVAARSVRDKITK